MGKVLNASPLHLQNILRSYTGTLGTYGLDAVDGIVNTVGFGIATTPSKGMMNWPIVRRFFKSGEIGSGLKNEYFKLRDAVDEVVGSINAMKTGGDIEGAREYQKEQAEALRLRGTVRALGRQLKKIRDYSHAIYINRSLSASEKRTRLDLLRVKEAQILRNIGEYRRRIGKADVHFPFSLIP